MCNSEDVIIAEEENVLTLGNGNEKIFITEISTKNTKVSGNKNKQCLRLTIKANCKSTFYLFIMLIQSLNYQLCLHCNFSALQQL